MGSEKSPDWAEKKIFTTGEAAVLCKVSQQTIIRCFDKGQLTGFRVPGSRFRRIPREDLLDFMERNGIPTDPLTGMEQDRTRVLLLLGDSGLSADIAGALRGAGVEVLTSGAAFAAGLLAADMKPTTIVVDGDVLGVDMVEACRAVRTSDAVRDAQVLVVSSGLSTDDVRALLEAGANEILTTPDATSLVAKIRNHRRAAGE